MSLENADLLPLYRSSDQSNRKITIANFKKDTQYRVATESAAPSNSVDGDLYWDTNDGRLYIYYDDGSTEQWVAASPSTQTDISGLVKLDDEGTPQAITGGGGLSVQFGTDAAQLGNIAPLNDWSVYPARS
jgi:hypothetical protein